MVAEPTMWDSIWVNCRIATMANGRYGLIANGAIACADGRIAWVGPADRLPAAPDNLARETVDLMGALVTPGLVDCHTHLVYGGNRAAEFEQRLQGVSYEAIARAGGGIVSTVRRTREASEAALLEAAERRLAALADEGVTTVEIKSGYGLETSAEMKQLRVARALESRLPVTVKTTFLGAHAVPPEYAGRQADYVAHVANEMLPAVAREGLADAVDAFCERIAFTPDETSKVFDAARALGLPVKLHADQLSDGGGAALAARYGALSADHLEYASEAGLAAMAAEGTVAVLLPGAFYVLRETKVPPVDAMRRVGVPIALSTDCNPGSSPVTSILLVLNMACTFFRMTPEEALAGVTTNGARALGVGATHGTLEAGKAADFVAWDVDAPAELAYAIGFNPMRFVVKGGRIARIRGNADPASIRRG